MVDSRSSLSFYSHTKSSLTLLFYRGGGGGLLHDIDRVLFLPLRVVS